MKSEHIDGNGFLSTGQQKKPFKTNKTIDKLKKIKTKINWGQTLVQDITFFIDLLQKNPNEFDVKQINKYIEKVNSKFKLTGSESSLNKISEVEYQQILRVLVHKANDDHTVIYFNEPDYIYSGFTAQFDIGNTYLIQSDKQKSETTPQSKKKHKVSEQKTEETVVSMETLDKIDKKGQQMQQQTIKHMQLVIDVVNDIELKKQIAQGDIITHINKEKAEKYLEKVADFCQRKTNSSLYNMQKTALMLGVYNVFFPVKSITVKTKSSNFQKQVIIQLKYSPLNKYLNFRTQSFQNYLYRNIDKLTSYVNNSQFFIDKDIYCFRIPSFMNQITNKDIQLLQKASYQDKNKVKLLIIDLRGNWGGYATSVAKLLSQVVDPLFSDFILYQDRVNSIDPDYQKIRLMQDVADIMNQDDLTDAQKEKYIEQSQQQQKYEQFLYNQNKNLFLVQNTNKPQFNQEMLKQIQTEMANQVLKKQHPGVVILTNYICKSSCSIFSKLLSLFPSAVIIGKEIQGFNQSGNTVSLQSPSRQLTFVVPAMKTQFNNEIALLLKSKLHPKIYIRNDSYPTNNTEFNNMLIENKQLLIDIITEQCLDFIKTTR